MLARTRSAAVSGIDAEPVEIEVNVTGKGAAAGGETCVSIVGLPDAAVRESRDRVRSALESSGLLHPRGFVVVNLAPADLRKEGAAFDLGIALGMLAATGTVDREALAKCAVFGELALNGTVRPVRGALPCAARIGGDPAIERILVPRANAGEAALSVEAGEYGVRYAITDPDGEEVDSAEDWQPLIARLENDISSAGESLQIIWP